MRIRNRSRRAVQSGGSGIVIADDGPTKHGPGAKVPDGDTLIRLGLLAAFPLAMAVAQPAHGQLEVKPDFRYAGGVLSATEYLDFTGAVPANKELDVHRTEITASLAAGATVRLHAGVVDVTGVPGSGYYGSIFGISNHGGGLANADYQRVTCTQEASGPCIVHKTALRNHGSGYGQWLYSDNVGPGVAAVRWIAADNPAVYGDTSYAIPNVDVIQGNVDVTNAVVQWNVSPGSTGDYLRIFTPDGSAIAFSIGRTGVITINGVTLDAYIDARIQKAGR